MRDLFTPSLALGQTSLAEAGDKPLVSPSGSSLVLSSQLCVRAETQGRGERVDRSTVAFEGEQVSERLCTVFQREESLGRGRPRTTGRVSVGERVNTRLLGQRDAWKGRRAALAQLLSCGRLGARYQPAKADGGSSTIHLLPCRTVL